MINEEILKKKLDLLNINSIYGLTINEDDLKKRRLDWFNKKAKEKEVEMSKMEVQDA